MLRNLIEQNIRTIFGSGAAGLVGLAFTRKHADVTNIPQGADMDDIRADDDAAFLARCRAQLEGLEVLRQEKFAAFSFRKKIGIPIGALVTPFLGYIDYWLLSLQSANNDKLGGLSIVFLGILYGWITHPKRQYIKSYKSEMLPGIARLFGNFTYVVDGRIPIEQIEPSKIVPKHDKYEGEDYFIGHYKGVRVSFSEVHFQREHRSKNGRHYSTVLKGLAVLLDMQTKRFYGHTVLDRDKGAIQKWLKQKTDKLKPANLVDPEFEKIFDVFTNDQVEARYIIDPVMIERIKGLQAEYEGESLTAAFYESKMLILIQSTHNYFEPADIAIPATDPQSILSMKREIGEILSVIDQLNLYDPAKVHAENLAGNEDDRT